jgi:hypothetical protein
VDRDEFDFLLAETELQVIATGPSVKLGKGIGLSMFSYNL